MLAACIRRSAFRALGEPERQLVEQHPTIGRQVLQPLIDNEVALAVVGWHHERWDGKGYPDRLAGRSIPLAARIVSVCDVLDAMTSPPAHREAHSWDAAVEAVKSESGTAFDPDVIDATLRCLDELKSISQASRHGD